MIDLLETGKADLLFKGMIGTVAGDDTILVIINDPSCVRTIINAIKHGFGVLGNSL